MSKHVFIDTVISKQRLNNILFYTGFHKTIIATEISTKGGGEGLNITINQSHPPTNAHSRVTNCSGTKTCTSS